MGKEMAEKRTRTMSVELAIQRELVFRRKIEELQLQPYDDSGDEIMPAQVRAYIISNKMFLCLHCQVSTKKDGLNFKIINLNNFSALTYVSLYY